MSSNKRKLGSNKVLKNDLLHKRSKNSLLLDCVLCNKSSTEKLIELRRCLEQRADVNTTDTYGYTPLHLAVQHEKPIVIKLLLKWGANVNAQSIYGRTPLHNALSYRDMSVVELLINKGADVNTRDKEGNTSLYLAMKSKNKPVVELLLNNGADANVQVQSKNGDMPLHQAVRLKDEFIVALLLDKGADVNAKTNDEKTSLHLAVQLENTAMVALLLGKGAKVNVHDKDGETPLYEAVRCRKNSIVKLLLDSGADMNAKIKSGNTSLDVAANTQQTAVMELILVKRVDVNAKIRGYDTPLHMAIRFGEPSIVEMLLNKGADVNAKTADGYTLLHEAARSGNVPVVELLLNEGATVNAQTLNGNTPLHEAAHSMEAHVVELLLNKGADVKIQATKGYTPIHVVLFCLKNYMAELLQNTSNVKPQTNNSFSVLNFAAFFGPHSIVDLLLNKGADVNVQIENGYTLLHYAARSGEKSAVELLLNKGANVNLRTNDGYTALYLAARSGNISVVELLLNKDADVNAQSINGFTPLHGAARSGTLPLCNLLLNKGAHVKAQTKAGHTLLHEAVCSKVRSVVELLLNNGADVNAKGEFRGVPLQDAVRTGEISMVELLINNGADVNAQDSFGDTAFHKAVHYKKTAIIELLLSKGADVNAQNNIGDTPLHEAAFFKELFLTELLVSNGANVNAQSKDGVTPLHNACFGDTSIFKFLLECEANVNASSRNGVTVLHRAVQSNELDMVKLLLKKGAKVNVQDSLGNTPLHEAVRHKNVPMADMLVRHGADVLLRNKADDTPLSIALLFSLDKNQYLVSLLELAEKKANDKVLVKNKQSQNSNHIFQTIEQDIITNNRLQNDKVKYSKTTDSFGLPGQLYETKILSLVFIRVLKHKQIEHDIFLGVNVNDIGAMDDICLRYQMKGGQRPTVIFMQVKHREDPERGKLTERALWSDSGDFSLQKYFASYLMIRELFRVGNKDPMFEGDYCNADCYFVLYTSAKENLMKKRTENKSEILHDLINTGQNTEPFQYNYDEDDIANLLKEVTTENHINPIRYNIEHVKDFFKKLWFYSNQGTQDKVECKVKDEINRHYNNKKDSNNFKFDLHTNAIFLKVHHEIQEWWKLKGKAPYLSRSNDFFKSAKIACLADVLLIVGNAMNDLKLSVDLEFKYIQHDPLSKTPGILNSKLCKLLKIINTEDMSITVDMNLKNEIVKLLLTDSSDQMLEGASAHFSSDISQDVCNLSSSGSLNTISNNDLYNNDIFEYSKKDGTSEVGGALFRMKMLCLVLLRLLNHEHIEQNPLLGTKIHGISFLNDICLRYKVKNQLRPVVLFMQLIHREDPEKGQLTNDEVWSDLGNFSLRKYFKSYFEIKDQFHVGNEDPMFEGDFSNVDCHFVLYTSAKENLTKKKQNDEMSDLLKNLIITKCNSEPFQYDHDEADIDCLTKVTVMDRIVKLGTNFLKPKDLKKNEVNKPNILADKLIARYHVAMRRKVLKLSETQSANNEYRIWEFRSEFFDSDDEYLVALRKTFVETVTSRRPDQGNTNVESQKEATEKNKLLQLKFKLPTVFGNLDMTFRGSEEKAQRRMKFVADKLMQLLKLSCVTKIVQINEEDVGPEKTLKQDIMDVNGGIGGAVGNLLVLDTHTNMLKFDLENKVLPRNATLFLKELKNEKYNPFNEDLSVYRIKININDFPQDSFKGDEFDKRQAKDFLRMFWYYPNQAKDVVVENILKKEISKNYSENRIHHDHNKNRNISDIISLNYCHQIQMWWMQTCESPYLSRASELFEHAELTDMYNLLQTVINYMYISDIYSIDIKVKQVDEDKKYDRMHQVFKKMAAKLFNLFDPQFNKPLYFSYNLLRSKKLDTFKLSLRIHPKMVWVSLYMTAGCGTDVSYRIFAKAGLSSGCQQNKDTFVICEQTFNEPNAKTYIRDCLAETFL